MRRLILVVPLLLLLIGTAHVASAAGTCKVTVSPSTVTVGQDYTITGTGFEANGSGFGLADLDSNQSAALISFDASGGYKQTFAAGSFLVGENNVELTDGTCDARATLTVVAAPGTDTVTPITSVPSPSSAPEIVLVLLAGFVLGWVAIERRRKDLT